MSLKANINREQIKELRDALGRMRLPVAIIDQLVSSKHGSNTYRAFRQGRRMSTPDGEWNINFAAKIARKSNEESKRPAATTTSNRVSPSSMPQIDNSILPDAAPIDVKMPDLVAKTAPKAKAKSAAGGSTMLSFQIEREYLNKIQTLAQKQSLSVSQVCRLAIKRFLGE